MSQDDGLILYGAPASQPSRAVYWTCLIQGLPFELYRLEPGQMGTSERMRAANPTGQIPTIEDGGFALYEMPAILIYLCEKQGWESLLPKDLQTRSRVHQYLHFHHNWTRRVTMELMAPHVTIAFRELMETLGHTALLTRLDDPNKLEAGRATATLVSGLIERGYFSGDAPFLCADRVTIADLACYEELCQLRWAGLFDFAEFPKIRRWLDAMAELPFHEPAHRYNLELGDIQSEPNTIERFSAASASGFAALEECGIRVRSID